MLVEFFYRNRVKPHSERKRGRKRMTLYGCVYAHNKVSS